MKTILSEYQNKLKLFTTYPDDIVEIYETREGLIKKHFIIREESGT